MKPSLQQLIGANRQWAAAKTGEDAQYFERLARGQQPRVLWIGCSDSRVSPDLICQTDVGHFFVHRNIANQAPPNDVNLLSVLQYAVEALQVEDVVVCGHYHCGGVNAALKGGTTGHIDGWLEGLREARTYYQWEVDAQPTEAQKSRRLVELNVLEQVNNLGKTDVLQRAWAQGARPSLSGWVFDLETGLIEVLHDEITNAEHLKLACKFERKLAYDAGQYDPIPVR